MILRPSGLRLTDIEPVNVANPDQEVALDRKAIDAVFTSAPFTELLEQKHLGKIVASPPHGIAGSGIFFGPSLLHNHEAASAVMTALRRAGAEIAGNGFYDPANLESYAKAPHRKRPGQKGYIEARLSPLQLQPGEYLLSIGLLANIPCNWEFYEYHHFGYDITVQREFLADNILKYTPPLNEVRLVARF